MKHSQRRWERETMLYLQRKRNRSFSGSALRMKRWETSRRMRRNRVRESARALIYVNEGELSLCGRGSGAGDAHWTRRPLQRLRSASPSAPEPIICLHFSPSVFLFLFLPLSPSLSLSSFKEIGINFVEFERNSSQCFDRYYVFDNDNAEFEYQIMIALKAPLMPFIKPSIHAVKTWQEFD